jgi:hypothetical protein
MAEGHCFFIIFNFFTALSCPALPCFEFSFCCQGQKEEVIQGTGSVFFPFAARDRRRKLHRELFFLLPPGTGGGSYTGNFFSFCRQGQEEEVTQGTFFPFAARDRRRKLHMELFFLLLPGTGGGSYTLHCPPGSAIEFVTGLCRTDNPVTDRHHTIALIYKIYKLQHFLHYFCSLGLFRFVDKCSLDVKQVNHATITTSYNHVSKV